MKIGALLHLTGEFAMQGQAFREGVELAIDSLNSEGSASSLQFAAQFEDSQYKPLQSHSGAKHLANNPEVIGAVVTTMLEAKAGGKIFEQGKLPTIVLWDSSPELEQIGDYLFGIGPWAPSSGTVAADFAKSKLGAKSAVIINTNTEWSVYVADWFEREFKKSGGNLLAHYAIDPSETDFKTILLKARALDPDVLYVPIDSNILPFFKQAKQLNITKPLLTSDILDIELFNEGGDLFEGVYQTMSGDPDSPQTKAMIEEYKKKFGRSPDFIMFTAWAYDAVRLIGLAARNGEASRENVKKGLYAVSGYSGASGAITFNSAGSAPRPVTMYIVRSRALVPVER
ncbi:MAG: ABC transporter substrate-binding protein [Deltaproteobacteria bacterium]|nr:ABC transporter substrate-binding protein [Deltaproteobacteria bacterium]